MLKAKGWTGFRAVLCPIDFSEHSRVALQYAEAIARRGRASLTITYANDPLLVAAAAVALDDRNLAKRSAGELRQFVDATLTADSKERTRIKSYVSVGNPADEIIKGAARHRSDLIVMGTHGLTGAGRLLVGSTTLCVLQRATVPVLAVPVRDEGGAASVPASWPGRQIVAAVELDRTAATEAEIAADIAAWFGSSLLLLHVVSEVGAPAWVAGDLSAHDRIRIAQAEQQIGAIAEKVRRRVRTDVRIVCGRVADEIAAVVASEGTELLVTALRDRRGWFGARRASICYHVVSHAVAPVLAYPPQWRPR